jgi:succinoglycan biosynthesis transport protein ExoP
MAFSNKVDVLPQQYAMGDDQHQSEQQAKGLQRQRWRVLIVSFLVVLVAALGWIWSRPEIFQSQAIIHFSYPQQIGKELSTVPVEQIQLNEQRLTSFRVIQGLSDLLVNRGLNVDAETLYGLLSTKAEVESRIITLSATGQDVALLEPVLSQWLSLYLDVLESETAENTSEDIQLIQQKLAALELKITEQRDLVEAFSVENNIVSIERDENRTLNKIKGLGASLDAAELKESQSLAALESVKQSLEMGKVVTRPSDQDRIAKVRSAVGSQTAELTALGQRYTQEYMQLDPTIVRKKADLSANSEKLKQMISASQARYIDDLQRNLLESNKNQQQLSAQLDTLSIQAKQFNQKLNEYKRLTTSLRQLEKQAQQLKNQVIEKEVEKPFEARLSVLEQPFVPSYPIGPNYLRDSLIAVAAALIVSIFSLLLFSFIVRQKQPPATMTSYTVVPPQNNMQPPQYHALAGQQEQQRLQGHAAPLQLAEKPQAKNLQLLSNSDCQKLYQVANLQGKQVIALLLNGASGSELLSICQDNFALEQNTLRLPGPNARSLLLPDAVLSLFAKTVDPQSEESIWQEALSKEDFNQLLINVAHDAGIAFPEQVSVDVLRHCYLAFLVGQGARLNDLEQVAGYISPTELAQYRSFNRQGELKPLNELDLSYTLEW